MTLTEQPTPPPGMRILSADELTKPLPMDAVWWYNDEEVWEASIRRGYDAVPGALYATATPPPTDCRKLVEELADTLADCELFIRVLGLESQSAAKQAEQARAALTRAKAALEESK